MEELLLCLQRIIMQEGYSEEIKAKEEKIQDELDIREKQEEMLWESKALEGERNTSFFHRTTIQHRQTNRISNFKDGVGNTLENHNQIEVALLNHFNTIMKEPQIDRTKAQDEVL